MAKSNCERNGPPMVDDSEDRGDCLPHTCVGVLGGGLLRNIHTLVINCIRNPSGIHQPGLDTRKIARYPFSRMFLPCTAFGLQ
jgi:hypothetical protein